MKPNPLISVLCLFAVGCAHPEPDGMRSSPYAARMKEAGDVYLGCVSREAEKDMKNPAGAEDIATAAHGRCWSVWDSYRDATNANFSHNARSSQEMQFSRDRAEGHVRQFEREAHRGVVDTVVERSLKNNPRP